MQPFVVHSGRVVPLRRSNVDTDQIIPSEYLKRVSRTGFDDGLFRPWRDSGEFPLDSPQYVGATILVAGPDFGTGSSREHAVWALQDWGFRAVISARFADIFRSNALKGGLLPVLLTDADMAALFALVEAQPDVTVTIDLAAGAVSAGSLRANFPLEESARRRLLHGLDDIDITLQNAVAIDTYEQQRPVWLPTTALPGA